MPFLSVSGVTLSFPVERSKTPVGKLEVTDDRLIVGLDGTPISMVVLDDISFELAEGDRLGIIGTNGAGKTTLLQVLSGIFPPDEGIIRFGGTLTSVINLGLGMQGEATGHENITLRGLANGYSRKQIETVRQEIVDFSELGEFLDQPVMTYSSGMKMRLNFAIATAFSPDILILDEWLSAGDIRFKAKATERMNRFLDDSGIVILASHSLGLLDQVCNLGLWLENGRVHKFGAMGDVISSYREMAS